MNNPDQRSEQTWFEGPQTPLLAEGEAHVWRARLRQDAVTLLNLHKSLSRDEQERAARFRHQRDREYFVASRGALRNILSRYAGVAPHLLHFSYNEHGKPFLSDEAGWGTLRFNLSHSNGLALCAVTRGLEVGIDLEFVREDFDCIELAEKLFSSQEAKVLRRIPPHAQPDSFFDCWTRKEAYVKARGEGLSYSLRQFTVSLAPGEPATLLQTYDDPQESTRWFLANLFPGEGYRAALAVKGKISAIHCWDWS